MHTHLMNGHTFISMWLRFLLKLTTAICIMKMEMPYQIRVIYRVFIKKFMFSFSSYFFRIHQIQLGFFSQQSKLAAFLFSARIFEKFAKFRQKNQFFSKKSHFFGQWGTRFWTETAFLTRIFLFPMESTLRNPNLQELAESEIFPMS